MKKCKNCGREMLKYEDFANKDLASEYCNICVKKDGKLRTYSDFRNIMVVHLLTKEGKELAEKLGFTPATTQNEAEKLADWVMKTMAENVPEINQKKDQV